MSSDDGTSAPGAGGERPGAATRATSAPGAGDERPGATSGGPIDSEEEAAAHLYALEPAAFIAARDLLVRSLRAAGQRPLADTVKGWRRPSVLAAELNRVLRADRGDLDRLLRAAEALRDGQQRVLAGGTADLGSLRDAHRYAASTLAGRAERDGDEVRVTLERASLDRAEHPGLLAASYTVPPTPALGFDLLDPGAVPTTTPERGGPATPRRPPTPAPTGHGSGDQGTDPTRPASSHGSGDQRPDPTRPTSGHGSGDGEAADARLRRERAQALAAAGVEVEAAGTALDLARRRRSAASDLVEQATRRIAELEARLAGARDHHLDAERRFEAARRAVDGAERRLEVARTILKELSEQ